MRTPSAEATADLIELGLELLPAPMRALLEANEGIVLYFDDHHAAHACLTSERPLGRCPFAVFPSSERGEAAKFLELVHSPDGIGLVPKPSRPPAPAPDLAPVRIPARPRMRARERRCRTRRSIMRASSRGGDSGDEPPGDDPDEIAQGAAA